LEPRPTRSRPRPKSASSPSAHRPASLTSSPRAEQLKEASDVRHTAHRHDGNAFRGKVSTTAISQYLERDLLAARVNKHNRPRVDAGARRRRCCRGKQPSRCAPGQRLDGC